MWVALEAPRWDLPDVPELESPDWIIVHCRPVRVERRRVAPARELHRLRALPVGASRPARATPSGRWCRDYTVAIDDHVLRYDIVRPEAPNCDDFPVFDNEAVEAPERRSRYRLHLPYTIVLRLAGAATRDGLLLRLPAGRRGPLRRLRRDRAATTTPSSPEVLQDFEDTIFEQDRRVVESQRPEHVPFDLAAEMHLKFDAVAINYRRAMREQGLARRAQPRSGAE